MLLFEETIGRGCGATKRVVVDIVDGRMPSETIDVKVMLDADGEVRGIVEAMGDPVANVTGELVELDDPRVKGKLLDADNMLDGRLEKNGGETVVVTVEIRELNESAPEFNPLVIDGAM